MASKACNAFQDEFFALLEKHGIDTYTMTWRDPDDSSSMHVDDGEALWRLGAIEVVKGQIIQRYKDAVAESQSDDHEGESWRGP